MSSNEVFQKKERLIKTGDFRKVYKDGRSFKKEFVSLRISPNTLPVNRIGFSISSKSIRKAYRRNRIRRLFREVYRKNKMAVKKGFDMALVIRRDPGESFSYNDAQNIYLNLSKEAGILL